MELYNRFCAVVPGVSFEESNWVGTLHANWGITEAPPEPWWDDLEPGFRPAFNFILRDRPISGPEPRTLQDMYIFPQGNSNPDEVAVLLQHFLARFRPASYVAFEVAYVTEGPGFFVPDSFGGAAYLVTKDGFEVMGTLDWLHKRIEERKLEEQDGTSR
jgi:hypothetical protein